MVITPSACTTSSQRVVHNTLYSLEVSTTTAHDAFLDQVVKGQVKTNGVPAVANAYNQFQGHMRLAIVAAQFNWTNPAPAELTAFGQAVIDAIKAAKQH